MKTKYSVLRAETCDTVIAIVSRKGHPDELYIKTKANTRVCLNVPANRSDMKMDCVSIASTVNRLGIGVPDTNRVLERQQCGQPPSDWTAYEQG